MSIGEEWGMILFLTQNVTRVTKEVAMRWFKGAVSVVMVGLLVSLAWATLEITPAMQKEIDRHIEVVKGWAANPVIVKAVLAQNEKGPIAGLDNAKWKTVRRSDDVIKGFTDSEAGKFLTQKVEGSNGLYVRTFLSAAQGEKVAFNEKTIDYLHKGREKFDVPFTSGKPWQGKPELDQPTQTYDVQVAVPVVSGGKSVGVLIVGINLATVEKMVKK
ncbi:MAG TPA: hypothetical protein VN203_24540 [Candidatus Acidoferrum sp.]|nr:hypothetical protein [Candidatus Acidoferrum sp.]